MHATRADLGSSECLTVITTLPLRASRPPRQRHQPALPHQFAPHALSGRCLRPLMPVSAVISIMVQPFRFAAPAMSSARVLLPARMASFAASVQIWQTCDPVPFSYRPLWCGPGSTTPPPFGPGPEGPAGAAAAMPLAPVSAIAMTARAASAVWVAVLRIMLCLLEFSRAFGSHSARKSDTRRLKSSGRSIGTTCEDPSPRITSNRAPGIASATSRAIQGGVSRSCSPTTTRVGAVIAPSRSRASNCE